jgi:threonine dehydrogenase-like Zn-dependent dehydrogenase
MYFDVNVAKILATKALSGIMPFVCYSPLSPVRYGEVPDRGLPGPRWLRVENIMTGICGADISMFFVKASPGISIAALPGVPRAFMGHETIGRVMETGPGVKKFRAGDRVTLQKYLPCCSMKEIDPPCPQCRNGNYTLCENFSVGSVPENLGAGFGAHMIAHESQLVKVPASIPDHVAVMIEPASVSLHAVLKRPPKKGQKVLVIGAGTIGLNVIQFAKALFPGCRLYLLEKIRFKKEMGLRLGADELIEGDPYDTIARATGAKVYRGPLGNTAMLGGFDIIYDCVGHSATIHNSLRWLAAGGEYVLIGNPLEPVSFDQTPVWHQELSITGINSHGCEQYGGRRISSFELAIEMIMKKKIDLEGFVTHRFSVSEYRQAFRLVKEKSADVIKAVLEIK